MSSRHLDEEEIFHIARTMDDSAIRAKYLVQICAGDQALRDRVEALLKVHEKEQGFLKSAAAPAPTVDQSPVTETPGEHIGRYKLLQKIGEGGFGVVYMAEQERPVRRKVALKIIKPGMDSRAVIARFEAERQALALMDHPNIARVLDGGTTKSERPYFVMELVKGVPIAEYCDKNQLTTRDRLQLFIAICQAVQHAHQKGIIHRDLKPANILVTLHDGQPVIKVIDFGVAKAIDQKLTEKTLFTSFGEMVGTLQYMSPEQAEMSGLDVDTRSDIYSLGVVLYELLTGTTPLEADRLRAAGYAEIQRIIREEEPVKPSTRLSTSGQKLTIIAKHRSISPDRLPTLIKGDLDWIVMKSIEKDRSRRYDTPLGLSQDVQRFLNHEPVEASPPSKVDRLRKLYLRNRARFVTACVALSLLVLGSITTAIGWYLAERNANKLNKSLRSNSELLNQKEVLLIEKADLAERNAKQAAELTEELSNRERRLYEIDMSEAFEAWRQGNIARAQELVNGHADSQVRRWECHFLSAQLNAYQSFDLVDSVFGLALRISPDQDYVAVMHPQRYILTLYEKATRKKLRSIGEERIGAWTRNYAEFSQDSRKLVHSANGKKSIFVRQLPSCDIIGMPHEHSCRIEHAVFRNDGNEVVFVNQEGQLFSMDTSDGSTRDMDIRLEGATSHSLLALSRDGRLLVHGGEQIDVIDLTNMTVNSLPGHIPSTWDIELLDGSNMLATCGFDRFVRVWDLTSRKEITTLGPFDDEVRALTYHPESKILAAATRARKIHRWNTTDFGKLPTITGFHGAAALEFDSEGDLYFLTQHNTLASHPHKHDSLPQNVVHIGGNIDFCLSADSRRVIVLQSSARPDAEPVDSEVSVFSLGRRGLALEHHSKLDFAASCVAPGRNDTVLLGDRRSEIVRVVSIPEASTLLEISVSSDTQATSIASSEELDLVAVGFADGGVWIGRPSNLSQMHYEPSMHLDVVSKLSWCEESHSLVSGSQNGSVCRTYLPEYQTEKFRPVDGPIAQLAALNSRVFISTQVSQPLDRTIMELNLQGKVINRSAPFTFHASGIAPLNTENTIVAVGQDRTLRFMDGDTLETRVSFSEDEIFKKIIASKDDRLLVASTREGSVFVYQRD